jgi:tRNA 2-thiouridine synthesizing protein B
MLHLLTEDSLSPAVTARIAASDSLVLLGGAVWAAYLGHSDNQQLQTLLAQDCRIYAMRDLLAAGGIDSRQLLAGVTAIDYPELVELTVQNPLIHTWC